MNRRKFIQNTSLATAGGLLSAGLPAWASAFSAGSKHVVLAVVAGISKKDFGQLFPKTFPHSLGSMGRLIPDMHYNGQAAGHRLALESILQGRYVSEKESGKKALTSTALFMATGANEGKYLITADREFLKPIPPPALMNAVHFCVGTGHYDWETPTRGTRPHATIRNADPSSSKATEPYEEGVNRRRANYAFDIVISNDLLIAETACEILQQEQPQLMVTHFMGADLAHANVLWAKENQTYIAQGLQRMWETVCNHPQLKDTLFVVIPDFGRNGKPNQIPQPDGSFGTDHNIADESTKEIAGFVAKPKGLPASLASKGESIDVLPTLLHFFAPGYKAEWAGKDLL